MSQVPVTFLRPSKASALLWRAAAALPRLRGKILAAGNTGPAGGPNTRLMTSVSSRMALRERERERERKEEVRIGGNDDDDDDKEEEEEEEEEGGGGGGGE